jgi:hypothetical protein
MSNTQSKLGNLVVTDVLLTQSQTSWRGERGQSMVLVALNDPKTNENGHLLYCLETDKRDIVDEGTWTDNPKLFAEEHPEADELQDLCSLTGNAERTKVVDDIMRACREGSQIEYKEGESGWGLYAS